MNYLNAFSCWACGSPLGASKPAAAPPAAPLYAAPDALPGSPPPRPQPHSHSLNFEYAGFWRRWVAALIDGLIVSLANGALGFALGAGLAVALSHGPGGAESAKSVTHGVSLVVGAAVSWLYFALMESGPSQATLGKQAIGIIVTDSEGEPISFARASGRHFAKYLSGLLLMIGYLMAGFTEKKQALHDMLAGCLVVMG
jgi:uncharacterized RDD family membrane protein YckC